MRLEAPRINQKQRENRNFTLNVNGEREKQVEKDMTVAKSRDLIADSATTATSSYMV